MVGNLGKAWQIGQRKSKPGSWMLPDFWLMLSLAAPPHSLLENEGARDSFQGLFALSSSCAFLGRIIRGDLPLQLLLKRRLVLVWAAAFDIACYVVHKVMPGVT